jgi:hypothetical protein
VRWYVTYKLSYRDVCDLMAECGEEDHAQRQLGVSSSRRRIESRRRLDC